MKVALFNLSSPITAARRRAWERLQDAVDGVSQNLVWGMTYDRNELLGRVVLNTLRSEVFRGVTTYPMKSP